MSNWNVQMAVCATFAALLLFPAHAAADQQAFIWTADDPELEWGPCPDYFPEGCGIAVLQGNPTQPNADVFLRLPAGAEVPLHWHSSAERMVLITGEFSVDYDGQDPVVMRAGTYAYGPAGLAHTAHCRDQGQCILFIAFEDPVDAIPGRRHEH
ncbi:MAG: cupin domain-containing protein [Wenzhouxiangella sp.]|nr:MAG: cupin domain-containing protein [Wenzhouxiangella sp.]